MISNQEGATNICATKRSSLKDLFGKSCTLEIRFINKVFGEGLFASADIPESKIRFCSLILDKVIFSCFPYCCAFFPDYKQIRCCYCGKEGKSTECETCQSVVYCSEQCKNLDKYSYFNFSNKDNTMQNSFTRSKKFRQQIKYASKSSIRTWFSWTKRSTFCYQVQMGSSPATLVLLHHAMNLEISSILTSSQFPVINWIFSQIDASEISVILFRNDHFQVRFERVFHIRQFKQSSFETNPCLQRN